MGDVASTFTNIGQVAGGLNSAVSAGMAINNALNPKQGPIGRIGLGSSSAGGLSAPAGANGANLAGNFKIQNYQNQDSGQSSAFGGGRMAGSQLPQVDRSHEMALLKTLQAFQG